jgi:hypothetical protein
MKADNCILLLALSRQTVSARAHVDVNRPPAYAMREAPLDRLIAGGAASADLSEADLEFLSPSKLCSVNRGASRRRDGTARFDEPISVVKLHVLEGTAGAHEPLPRAV